MSAYNIELPGIVLAGLYKKAIVQGEGKAVVGVNALPLAEDRVEAPVAPSQASAGGQASAGVSAATTVAGNQSAAGTTAAIEARVAAQPGVAAGGTGERPINAVTAAGTVNPVQATGATEPVRSSSVPGSGTAEPVANLGSTTGIDVPPVSTTVGPAQPLQPSASSVYKILGNNRQQVSVIVRSPGEAFLPENNLQLLTKMLGACKLNLGDVAIVNDANLRVDMNLLKRQLQPKTALLFGVTPEEAGLPLSFPAFKAQEYAGTTYLFTPSLDELNMETEDGKLLKRRLWDSLRKIFGV
ncbi:hypothetical protein [Paraflavitalea sp. CAU 1676]|uniref:hypothetical protein n=1 Tax=Paraflavitalea sp. CAU 1676 TaxID=3032598 RepID=UPI0023DB9AD1|nr:hypothetical protein [Paraflavitalea sp. CAU 1676]MDF2191721.1 hypothetical protein [Paraflavitalea sp. CAU 1676]